MTTKVPVHWQIRSNGKKDLKLHIQEFRDHLNSVFPSPLDKLTLLFDVIKVYKSNLLHL